MPIKRPKSNTLEKAKRADKEQPISPTEEFDNFRKRQLMRNAQGMAQGDMDSKAREEVQQALSLDKLLTLYRHVLREVRAVIAANPALESQLEIVVTKLRKQKALVDEDTAAHHGVTPEMTKLGEMCKAVMTRLKSVS